MPIHDWTRPPVGLFHHFHQQWAGELCNALNAGILPAGYYALVDQRAVGLVPDVLAPQADRAVYAARANRIAIYHWHARDRVRRGLSPLTPPPLPPQSRGEREPVAVIEIVSPGNKDSRHALRAFVGKAVEFLEHGVNLLVVDLFPPTPRDPQGIHKAIWDEIREEPFDPPPDKPLTVAAYSAAVPRTAYVEPVGVGDVLPAAPVFLDPGVYVPAPLEPSYQVTWAKCPEPFKDAVVNPPA